MSEKSNQTTTGLPVALLKRAHRALNLWSVQASNLRPPVYVKIARNGKTRPRPCPASHESRQAARIAGESAHRIGNQKAIDRVYRNPAFWRFLA